MARYWVGETAEHGSDAEPSAATPDPEPERLTDALRRSLAGNVTADERSE